MKWVDGKKLESKKLIDEFEKMRGYTFPKSFKKFIVKNNGATPEFYCFDTEESVERVFGYLFSFNKEDDSALSMWDAVEAYEGHIETAKMCEDFEDLEAYEAIYDRYILFADTAFGDEIAFDRYDDSIVFIDSETLDVEKIAEDFDDFLECFYEGEDDDED